MAKSDYTENSQTCRGEGIRNMKNQSKKTGKHLIPVYGIVPIALALIWNTLAYNGGRWIASGRYHYHMETVLDDKIPFVPWAVIIYFGCYLFWAVNYILIARQDKESVYRFFTADALSRIVCFGFYVLFPTTNTRPEIVADGFWNQIVLCLYSIDAADNLFPSIHCLVSWFCFLGIRGRKEIPKWYQYLSAGIAVCVFLSTLTTKQHVLWDVAGGVLLAELCFWLGKRGTWYRGYQKFCEGIQRWMFRLAGGMRHER